MNPAEDQSWEEIQRQILPLMKADDGRSVLHLLGEYTYLAAVLASGAWYFRSWSAGALPTAGFVLLASIVVTLVAIGQHRLSGLAHDASHSVLFRNRLANELVSDLFLLFPLVAITQQYRAAHLGHHRYVNDPEHDPDLVRINTPRPHAFPVSKAGFWYRYVVKALWPPSTLLYLFGRAKAANVGANSSGTPMRAVYRTRVARCLRGTYWLTVVSMVHLLDAWPIFLLFWVLPLLTVYPLLMQLREIAHHSNAPDDGDLTNSRVFRVNPLLAAAVFPYGQAFHLTHHLFAKVPSHRLPEAHAILCGYGPYREKVIVCQGYFFRRVGSRGPSVLDVLAERRVERRSAA